jgi:hypothetical protein
MASRKCTHTNKTNQKKSQISNFRTHDTILTHDSAHPNGLNQLQDVRWGCAAQIETAVLSRVTKYLQEVDMIDRSPELTDPHRYISPLTSLTDTSLPEQMYNWRIQSIFAALQKRGKVDFLM